MSVPVDMPAFVRKLPQRRRGQACIVLTRDPAGAPAWAETLAVRAEATHLDLLDHFQAHPGLTARVSEIGPRELLDLLKESTPRGTLVVSGLEFLRATWQARPGLDEDLAKTLEFWMGPPSLVLVLAEDRFYRDRDFSRMQQPMIVHQTDTYAL